MFKLRASPSRCQLGVKQEEHSRHKNERANALVQETICIKKKKVINATQRTLDIQSPINLICVNESLMITMKEHPCQHTAFSPPAWPWSQKICVTFSFLRETNKRKTFLNYFCQEQRHPPLHQRIFKSCNPQTMQASTYDQGGKGSKLLTEFP